jgi:hypothetical protein
MHSCCPKDKALPTNRRHIRFFVGADERIGSSDVPSSDPLEYCDAYPGLHEHRDGRGIMAGQAAG